MAAKKQGLLFATENAELITTSSTDAPSQQRLSLFDLVPRHVQDSNDGKMNKSFISPADLPNRQVRQVYTAIDGQKTVAELASFTQLSIEEVRASLRILLLRHRVRLYEPGGLQVESMRYINSAKMS